MDKEFVPYEESIELKKLGFDDICYGYYEEAYPHYLRHEYHNSIEIDKILAPLYQQVFRWFRTKYQLHSFIHSDYSWNISGGIWDLNGYIGSRYDWDSESFETYEEAQIDCVRRLIKIVKENES